MVRTVSWPVGGDRATFRRRAARLGTAAAALVIGAVAAAGVTAPASVLSVLPLAAAAGLLAGLWIHGAARTAARRAEIERSFAGLAVLHGGRSFQVASRGAVLGEHPTRREAARAAVERGGWAVVVQAWDRYYVLAAAPAPAPGDRPGVARVPVSFRSRAVADVVPAVATSA